MMFQMQMFYSDEKDLCIVMNG